jgi:hypothetical protein
MSSMRLSHDSNARQFHDWSWLAPALALAGMLLPMTGGQAAARLQILCFAGSSADEGENEFPGEDQEGDSAGGDLESHLPLRRLPRESFASGLGGELSAPLNDGSQQESLAGAFHQRRCAAASNAVRIPLRC